MSRLLVLGGGFGGLAAAHELRRLLPAEDAVTVVANRTQFFVGFAKLWDLVGSRALRDGSSELTGLERHGIEFLHAEVTEVDPAARRVQTSAGPLSADGLIVALGAGYDPGHLALLGPRAHNLYDATALPAIRADLDALQRGRLLVAILGAPYLCPPAPFEAALLLDEWLRARGRRPQVELAVSTPAPLTLPVAGPDASRYLADQLGERGVTVLTDHRPVRTDHAGHSLQFAGRASVDWQLLLAVPAAAPPAALATSPLAGPSGWIEPDRLTFGAGFERVYAVGDCTQIPTASGQLPKAGVFAAAAGQVAARNLAADLHGGDRSSFDGHGYCFLELPGQRVAKVQGNFYAEPRPQVTLVPPDTEAFGAKQRWEQDLLSAWLG